MLDSTEVGNSKETLPAALSAQWAHLEYWQVWNLTRKQPGGLECGGGEPGLRTLGETVGEQAPRLGILGETVGGCALRLGTLGETVGCGALRLRILGETVEGRASRLRTLGRTNSSGTRRPRYLQQEACMGNGNQTGGNQELSHTLHLHQFKDAALPEKSRGGGCCSGLTLS